MATFDASALLREAVLRLHRDSGELSSRKVAERTNGAISHSTVQKILKNNELPRWDSLEAFVIALGGDVKEFERLWTAARSETELDLRASEDPSEARDIYKTATDGSLPYELRVDAIHRLSPWRGDDVIYGWLKGIATEDQHYKVRIAAVRSISNWRPDPDVALFLCSEVIPPEEKQHHEVRTAAVESLACWSGDSRIEECLKRVINHDEHHHETKVAAISVLGAGWRGEPSEGKWLREIADSPKKHNAVRCAAVRAIAEWWNGYPETGDWLRGLVRDPDEDGTVRLAALKGLAEWYEEDKEARELVRDSINDHYWRMQLTAIECLPEQPGDSAVCNILIGVATDASRRPEVRQAAIYALTTGWREANAVLAALNQLVEDSNRSIRQAAREALSA